MGSNASSPSTLQAEVEACGTHDYLWLHQKLKTDLGYMNETVKKKKNTKKNSKQTKTKKSHSTPSNTTNNKLFKADRNKERKTVIDVFLRVSKVQGNSKTTVNLRKLNPELGMVAHT